MFAITQLDADSQKFINYLAAGARSKSHLASICIGRVIASQLLLPSSPVEDVQSHYRMAAGINVLSMISDLNELVALDSDTIVEFARKFYILRYKTLFATDLVVCMNSETTVEDFFGISMSIDRESIKDIQAAPGDAMQLYNGMVKLLPKLKANGSADPSTGL